MRGSRSTQLKPPLLLFGAGLLVFTALVASFFQQVVHFISNVIFRQPKTGVKKVLVDMLKRLGGELKQPRRLLRIVVVLTAVFLVAWSVQPAVPKTVIESGELIIMSAFGESPSDPRRILINQWNQAHPDNLVKVVDAPGEPDQQRERLVNNVKMNGKHEADVYVLDNVWMAEFIEKSYIQPFDESLRSSKDTGFSQMY
jgi:multiple sugar transport system substrate-binding protein